MIEITGRTVVGSGKVRGPALVSPEPICFLGGVDVKTGNITEQGHPIYGECIKDTVFIFPTGKGSTGGAYLIYETIYNGNGPVCMINKNVEQVTAAGCVMGDLPLIDRPDQDPIALIKTGDMVEVDLDTGKITVNN